MIDTTETKLVCAKCGVKIKYDLIQHWYDVHWKLDKDDALQVLFEGSGYDGKKI